MKKTWIIDVDGKENFKSLSSEEVSELDAEHQKAYINDLNANREEKQAELVTDRNRAIEQLGTADYEQEAYLHMLSKYDAAQAMSEDYDYPYGYGL